MEITAVLICFNSNGGRRLPYFPRQRICEFSLFNNGPSVAAPRTVARDSPACEASQPGNWLGAAGWQPAAAGYSWRQLRPIDLSASQAGRQPERKRVFFTRLVEI